MLRLTTLGATDLRDRHGHPIREVLAQPKRVALLVYLAVEGARVPVSRDRLLGMFWPESDESRARNALSQALHALRQGLGADVIESQGATTVEVHSDQLWCDATAFTQAIERGETELALDLYRGEFCPTLFLSDNPEVEQWMDRQRSQLRRMALASARAHAERQVGGGDLAGAARTARRGLAMQPDDEADVRALLTILERAGDVAGALYAHDEYARRLTAELETEPAPETARLVEAMRQRREAAVASAAAKSSWSPGAERSVASTPGTPLSKRRGPRPAFLLAAGIVLAVVAGAVAIRSGAPPATPPGRRLAVLPFVMRGGPPNAYLGEGMVDLLSTKLDGAAGFHTIDPRSVVAAVTRDSGGGRAVRRLGAGWYVSGEVVEVAGRLQLNASLYDVTSTVAVAKASVSGDTAGIFQLVDDLAGRILAGLTPGRDTTLTRLASLTTHSLSALKAFLNGEQAMRAGRDAEAAAAFMEAVALDSAFALAQYRLAMSSTWISVLGVDIPEAAAARAAVVARRAQHLSPLARDLLDAYGAYKALDGAAAERSYLAATRGHPDNVEAWFMLGETWFHYNPHRGRSPAESRPAFERVLELDPGNSHAVIHLARLAALEGRAADLDSLARRYDARYSGAERIAEIQALQSFVSGDSAEWVRVAGLLRRGDALVAVSSLQGATVYAQNLDAARALAPAVMQFAGEPITRRIIGRALGELALEGGQWHSRPAPSLREASAEDGWLLEVRALMGSDPFFRIEPSRLAALRDSLASRQSYPALGPNTPGAPPNLGGIMRDYLVGLLSVRLGDTATAARRVRELAAVRGAGREGPAREASHALRAEILRSGGDARAALAELEHFVFLVGSPPVRSLSHWGVRERFLRAELLHALGRDEEALPWYDSFHGGYDGPFMAAAQFRRGQIHQRLGSHERARFHFGRFLHMWKDSDPEFRPIVDEARRALVELRT